MGIGYKGPLNARPVANLGTAGWIETDPDPEEILASLQQDRITTFQARGSQYMALVEQNHLEIVDGDILGHEPLTFQVVTNNSTSIDGEVDFHLPKTFDTPSLEFDPHYDVFVKKFWDLRFKFGEFHQFIVDRIEGATIGTTNPLLMKLVRAGVVQETSPVGSKHIYGLTRNTLDDYTTRHSETAAQPYPLA